MTKTAAELLQALADADNLVASKTGELKDAKQKYSAVEDEVFKLMDELGTETLRNAGIGLQATISESEVETIEDWPKFEQFVLRRKAVHLFQRRLSAVAVRELLQSMGEGASIPGIGKFAKRRLHVTKISK